MKVDKVLSIHLSRMVKAVDKDCFRNAAMGLIALNDPTARYVEGHAVSKFHPIHHGWIEAIGQDGPYVIEVTPTWLDNDKVKYYPAVHFTRDEVARHVARYRVMPILNSDVMPPPLRQSYSMAMRDYVGAEKWPTYREMFHLDNV